MKPEVIICRVCGNEVKVTEKEREGNIIIEWCPYCKAETSKYQTRQEMDAC